MKRASGPKEVLKMNLLTAIWAWIFPENEENFGPMSLPDG